MRVGRWRVYWRPVVLALAGLVESLKMEFEMQWSFGVGGSFRRASLLLLGLLLAAALPTDAVRAQSGGAAADGTATIQLPDGRTLVSGVLSGSGSSDTVWLADPRSGQLTAAGTLQRARRQHSATLLPDGRVLILGGIDDRQQLVDTVEVFEVGTGRSETIPLTWRSRSGHTATLLDSTRVLVAGGVIDGQAASDIEIIDLSEWNAAPLAALGRARRGHLATLLADGRTELSGGEGTEGPLGDLRTFIDATTGLVRESWWPEPEDSFPWLAASEPADGATVLTLQPTVMLRLTRRARMDSVNSDTVTLEGPAGRVAVRVVPAEAGRLVFVTPQEPLDPRTSYRLSVDGVRDATGQDFPSLGIAFQPLRIPRVPVMSPLILRSPGSGRTGAPAGRVPPGRICRR
ncbi:MAG TPA: kelch repeat-containing protein [Vicinamibacterales bacterium]|nr:kelch repeat-containing protein [Vicinamibacterales bacterium]